MKQVLSVRFISKVGIEDSVMSKIKDSSRIIAMLKQQTHGICNPFEFKGQGYIPHKPRNNRKTKKGGKK